MTSLVRRLVRPLAPSLDPLVRAAVLAVARARKGPQPSTPATEALYAGRPILLGHRGAMARAPENTLGAFQAAVDDGADGFELDVQLSADAVPVVLHDDTLDRTTNLKGLPIRFGADELDDADAGTWFAGWGTEKVPRLDEVLARFPRAVINVELKGPTPPAIGLERRALESIRAHATRVVVSSFHPAQLLAVRRIAPELPTALLVSAHALLPLRTAWAAPLLMPDAIHPPSALVDAAFVGAAHQAGMRVNVWAVGGAADAERLLDLGVDGLIVDDVKETAAIFRARYGDFNAASSAG